MEDLVSVIVPVYNTASYLERCVESVLNQTHCYFELLLIDDGSTDGSDQICDKYAESDARIIAIHKRNGGVSSARNLGLQNIKGSYFMFLDSDDWLETATLQVCVEAIKLENADAVIFGRKELKDNRIIKIDKYPVETITNIPQMIYDVLKDRHAYGGGYSNKMWRNNTPTAIPRFSEELFYVEDMEWTIRMIMHTSRIKVIEGVYYCYDLREDSISHSERALDKRLIGYHHSMAQIVEDLVEYPELQIWFKRIRYTELIDSIIDAKLKKQENVYRSLYLQLDGQVAALLRGNGIKRKAKIRLLGVKILHFFNML